MKSRTATQCLKLTWMEAKLFLRDPMSAFFTLIFPLIYLFMFGIISGNKPTPQFGGQPTLDASIPGLMAVIICITGLMAITMNLSTYREKGILRRLRTTPVSPLIVLVAQVIVVFVMTCLGMLLLVAAGMLFYHVRFEGRAFSLFAGFLLSSLSFFGIGFILAGSLPTVRSAWTAGMVLMYPMMFLSGAFFTVDLLPDVVQKVSAFMPLTYVVNLLRGLWMGDSWSLHVLDVVVLAVILAASVLISTKTFRWE